MSFDFPELGASELTPDIDDEDLLNFFLSGEGLTPDIPMHFTPDADMHSHSSNSSSSSSSSSSTTTTTTIPSSSAVDAGLGGRKNWFHTPDVITDPPSLSDISNPSSLSAPLTPRSDSGDSGLLDVGSMKQSASSQIISSLGQVSLDSNAAAAYNGSIFLGGGFGGFGGHLGTINEVNEPNSFRKFNTNTNNGGGGGGGHSHGGGGSGGGNLPKTNKSLNLHGQGKDNDSGEDSGEEGSVEDKKKRRLTRNRESARQSRKRKKQYLELLEDKVEQLTSEVNLLRQKRLEQAAKELHQQWQAKISLLEPVANALATELIRLNTLQGTQKEEIMQPQVQDGLNKLNRQFRLAKMRFGPNSSEYLKILNHHFDLMKHILLPPYTRFLLWAMDQGDEFFKGGSQRNRGRMKSQSNVTSKVIPGSGGVGGNGGNAANLWPLVWNELGLTYEQEEKTKATFADLNTKENIQARRHLVVAMNLMDRIHRVTLAHGAGMQSMADRVSNVLEPCQQIRFFAWYERNRKRIHNCGMDRGLSKTGNPNNHLQGTFLFMLCVHCWALICCCCCVY